MGNQYKSKPDISVLIPYFREPEKLRACVNSIVVKGGDDKYEILVALDDDDPMLSEAAAALVNHTKVKTFTWPRPDTLGQKLNKLAEQAKGHILWFISQDYTMETEGWPDKFRNAVSKLPNGKEVGILFPKDVLHPDHAAYPIVTRKMYETLGYFVPSYFPYWFVDTWHDELGILIGVHQEIDVEVKHQGERGKSHGLVDLKFWAEFFMQTRYLRVQDAVKLLRVIHGITPDSPPPIEMQRELNRRAHICQQRVEHLTHPKFIEAWENNVASAPSPAYPKVKAEAEAVVQKIRTMRPRPLKVAICVPSAETWRAGTAVDIAGISAHSIASGIEVLVINLQGSQISHSRNNIVGTALENNVDYLMWIDSDMKLPKDTIVRLLQHKKDIVGATYNKKVPPFETLGKLAAMPPADRIPDQLQEALLLPGGVLLVKADVYRKIGYPAYFETYMFAPGQDGLMGLKLLLANYFRDQPPKEVLDSLDGSPLGEWVKDHYFLGEASEPFLTFSEDLNWCRKVRRAGYKIWVDLALTHEVKHLGTREVTCQMPWLVEQEKSEAAD